MAVRDVGAGALGRVAGFTTRHARWVIGLWLLAAALMTFVVPRVEDVVARDATPFLPADSPSIKALGEMDQGFGEGSGRSISFIVLTGDRLHDDQQTDAYYDRLSTRLHADRRHIADLQDYAAQLRAIRQYDVTKDYGGDLHQAAAQVRARTLAVYSWDDHMVTAGPVAELPGHPLLLRCNGSPARAPPRASKSRCAPPGSRSAPPAFHPDGDEVVADED